MPDVVLPTFTSGQPVYASDLTKLRNAISELRPSLSAVATVANTTSETAVATLTIAANDASAGAIYRIKVQGIASVTGTPTITFRARLGGVAGTQLASSGALTASSGISNHTWECDVFLVCLTTGSGGTWYGLMDVNQAITVAGSPPFTPASRQDGTASISKSTTVDNDFVVTVQWSAASSSNTATCEIALCQRIIA